MSSIISKALVAAIETMKKDHLAEWDKQNEREGSELLSSVRDTQETLTDYGTSDDHDDVDSAAQDFRSALEDYRDFHKPREQIEKSYDTVINRLKGHI